jgi:hypothetical protein
MYGKNHTKETIAKIKNAKYIPIKITNVLTGIETIIIGYLPAAKHLNISKSTLSRYKKQGKLYNNIYYISNG